MLVPKTRPVPDITSNGTQITDAGQDDGHRHSEISSESEVPTQTTTGYRYQEFQWSDEIRLLKLHRRSNGPELTAELVHVRLSGCPTYEAVSYTWADWQGDASLTREIAILPDRNKLPITKNCKCALWRFRENDSDRVLWIDSICIDQTNLQERSHQVRKMAEIYKNAERVLIYLHPGPHLSCISRLNNVFSYIKNYVDNEGKRRSLYNLFNKKKIAHGIKTDLENFFGISWFWRIWVIQEVVMAKAATLYCGSCHLDWTYFAPNSGFHQGDGLIASLESSQMEEVVPPVLRISKTCSPRSTDLIELIFATKVCGATDPRDKVYALLWCDPNGASGNLAPDYTKSVAQVLKDSTLHCLLNTHNLKILSLIQRPHETAVSWIPDLVEPIKIPPLVNWVQDWTRFITRNDPEVMDYTQAPHQESSISSPGFPSATAKSSQDVYACYMEKVQHILDCSALSIESCELEDDTIVDDFLKIIQDLPDSRKPWMFSHFHISRFEVDFPEDVLLGIHIIPLAFPQAVPRLENEVTSRPYYCLPLIKQLLRLIIGFGTNRKLILTDNGIGVGPIQTRKGDKLYHIQGAKTPFVLRSLGNKFLIVDECAMMQAFLEEPCVACGYISHPDEPHDVGPYESGLFPR